MITIVATALKAATLPLLGDTPFTFADAKVHILFGSHNTPPSAALRMLHLKGRESLEISPYIISVETDGFVRLYTNRLLTHQRRVTLSDDYLVLEMLRITPFLARGFCDTN